jgi:uncharacterized protein involved in tolerance to divalent cations
MPPPSPDNIAQLTLLIATVPTQEKAFDIARVLAEGQLAAEVSCIPLAFTLYRRDQVWNDGPAWLIVIRTPPDRVVAAREALVRAHPDGAQDLLEVGATALTAGYNEWVFARTMHPGDLPNHRAGEPRD